MEKGMKDVIMKKIIHIIFTRSVGRFEHNHFHQSHHFLINFIIIIWPSLFTYIAS